MAEVPDEVVEQPEVQPESQEEGRIPYERFKAVNDELSSLKGKLAKIEESRAEADQRAKEEQGKWEELYKQSLDQLEQEKIERLRIQIASESGLRPELSNRIMGSTEEEMREDVKSLLELQKPLTGPGVPTPAKATQPVEMDLSQMSPKEIRENINKIING